MKTHGILNLLCYPDQPSDVTTALFMPFLPASSNIDYRHVA